MDINSKNFKYKTFNNISTTQLYLVLLQGHSKYIYHMTQELAAETYLTFHILDTKTQPYYSHVIISVTSIFFFSFSKISDKMYHINNNVTSNIFPWNEIPTWSDKVSFDSISYQHQLHPHECAGA
jgi:hypothetical protein